MKQKDEVLHVFQSFYAMIQNQFSSKLRVIRSDNDGEYVNQRFRTYFEHHGLVHETSCPQTSQQNGIAKRKHRHILETARSLLREMHVPP